MIIVCQVNRSKDTYYTGTERVFEQFQPALDFLVKSFKNMYGSEAEYHCEFWDPELKDQSSQIYSIEMFAPGEDDGWYLYKAYEKLH